MRHLVVPSVAVPASSRVIDVPMAALQIGMVLTALEAVAIGPVPLEWLGTLVLISGWLCQRVRRSDIPLLLTALLGWAVLVQLITALRCAGQVCVGLQMPSGATTPYPVYIGLRLLSVVALMAGIGLVRHLADRREEIIDFLVRLGTWLAIIAFYVYIAQLTGLPDIPRTRLGTDGRQVTEVVFSYAFHRANGTFREPSGLATFLMAPFLLSLRSLSWRSIAMGGAILLTGSMTAFVGVAAGMSLAFFYVFLRGYAGKRWLGRAVAAVAIGIVLALVPFWLLAKGDADFALLDVIVERLLPVIEGGVRESNRGYVYDYFDSVSLPLVGPGLGNADIIYSSWKGVDVIAGLLSLYINFLLSLGVVGFALLILFLARPLIISPSGIRVRIAWPLFASYFSFLVIFLIHSAEFPPMFGLIFGLLYGLRRSIAPRPW